MLFAASWQTCEVDEVKSKSRGAAALGGPSRRSSARAVANIGLSQRLFISEMISPFPNPA